MGVLSKIPIIGGLFSALGLRKGARVRRPTTRVKKTRRARR